MVASLVCWIQALRRCGSFAVAIRALAPAEIRTAAFWSPLDAVMLMFLPAIAGSLVYAVLLTAGLATAPASSAEFQVRPDPLAFQFCKSVGNLAVILLGTLLLARRGPIWTSIGWPFRRRDLTLGWLWALLLIPPTLAINASLNFVVQYEHPVLDLLAGQHDWAAIVLLFLGVAIVTPIAEEFLFRGLLQGSMTRVAMTFGIRKELRDAETKSQRDRLIQQLHRYSPTDLTDAPMWPIVVSSVIFAAMHLGQGAAPIPLFVLALGLGWLYRRTGRLWPSIIVHMLLNTLSLAVFLVAPDMG